MMSNPNDENESQTLWHYVSITDYNLPLSPVTYNVKKRLNFIRRLVQQKETQPESPFKAAENLEVLPQEELDNIAPEPNWGDAAESLYTKLEGWLSEDKTNQLVITLIGPPFSGLKNILEILAEGQNWQILRPPSAEQILVGDQTWLNNL
ncbi:MAG: hypothetical protein ACNA8H_06635, partial [Anaerolineales bacterium]